MVEFLEDIAARVLMVAAVIFGIFMGALAAMLFGFTFALGALMAAKLTGVI